MRMYIDIYKTDAFIGGGAGKLLMGLCGCTVWVAGGGCGAL